MAKKEDQIEEEKLQILYELSYKNFNNKKNSKLKQNNSLKDSQKSKDNKTEER